MADAPWVGVDIGGTKLLLVAFTSGEQTTHRVTTGLQTAPEAIEAEILRFAARLGRSPAGLGIAVPGRIDTQGRVAACDVLPRLVGWAPARGVLGRWETPLRVLNDAAAALVEEACDLGPSATAALVMAGTAIGAAFQVDGVSARGACGWAGELGYLPVATARGVQRLDDLAGGAAVAARLGTDGAGLSERAARGDAAAIDAIREAGAALGIGLATVINLLNPEHLVLGGGACALPGYRTAALASAERHSLPVPWRACTIRPVRAGDAVVALGAARAACNGT